MSSCGPNWSGFTKTETTTKPVSRRARASRARWPACSAPMVGTKPTSAPARRAASAAARSSALVATARTSPQSPEQLESLVRVLAVVLVLALEGGLHAAARVRVQAPGGGGPVTDQPGQRRVHLHQPLLAGERLDVHADGAAFAPDPRPRHAGLPGGQRRVDAGVDQAAEHGARVDHAAGPQDVGGAGRQGGRAVG